MTRQRRSELPVVRQELLYVEFNERKPGMPSRLAKRVPMPDDATPDRLWTLYHHTDPNVRPELPFHPVHNHNAFLEDWIHDWDIAMSPDLKPFLHYASRVIDRGVWVLLEYRGEKT